MDIKYEIEPVFKIEFFNIKCCDYKNKKQNETKHFDNMKPYIIVNNNFNIESANDITESRRYFNLNT